MGVAEQRNQDLSSGAQPATPHMPGASNVGLCVLRCLRKENMLDESTHLFEYMVLHYSHLVEEPLSADSLDWSEESIRAEANSIDPEMRLRSVLDCQNPRCLRYSTHYAAEMLDDLFELTDEELFSEDYYRQIAKAVVQARCKPLLDSTGRLAPDLREIVTETLRIVREEKRNG
jgi:hypothetical protein